MFFISKTAPFFETWFAKGVATIFTVRVYAYAENIACNHHNTVVHAFGLCPSEPIATRHETLTLTTIFFKS